MGIFPMGLITVLILLLIEMRLASKWSPFYFRKGIQLYSKEFNKFQVIPNLDDLVHSLNKFFKGTGFSPSIRFHKIDGQTIAFREKFFEFSLFNYTPLMHGKIEINNTNINVIGIANWYPIAFICLWYSFLSPNFRLDVDFMFLIAPIIIFGVIYFIQSKKYNKIASQLFETK